MQMRLCRNFTRLPELLAKNTEVPLCRVAEDGNSAGLLLATAVSGLYQGHSAAAIAAVILQEQDPSHGHSDPVVP